MTKELGMQSGPSKMMLHRVLLVFQRLVQGTRSELQRLALRGCHHGTIYSSSAHLPREEAIEHPMGTLLHMSMHAYFGITCHSFFFFKCIIAKLQNPQICVYYSNNLNMYSYPTIYRTLLPCK